MHTAKTACGKKKKKKQTNTTLLLVTHEYCPEWKEGFLILVFWTGS
jgi:hypothetical protein